MCKEYSSVLDGVTYVDPVLLDVHWWRGVSKASELARLAYGPHTITQCWTDYGWVKDRERWPNFMVSMLDRTGVPLDLSLKLPLVLDRRDSARENLLFKASSKPFIAVNTTGYSSPFKHSADLLRLLSVVSPSVGIVDIGRIRAERVYDVLGIMDRAIGGIHIDSATLHLAHACPKPYIAFTQDGWLSSVPRGNCVLNIKYSGFGACKDKVLETIRSWM